MSSPVEELALEVRPSTAEPGVWPRCAGGEHALCLYELRVNAPWATAGLAPPSPGAPTTAVERCACTKCRHVGRAKTLDGSSPTAGSARS